MRRLLSTCVAVLAAGILLTGCEVEEPTSQKKKAEESTAKTALKVTPDGPEVVDLDPLNPGDLIDKPLPDFDLPDTQGTRVTKASLKGKVVLIDFWATWCAPCRRISPVLNALHKKYSPEGLVVLGADTGEHDPQGRSVKNADLASYYAKDNNYSYTFLYGCDDYQQACHVKSLPSLLLVDREGVVRDVFVGVTDNLPDELLKAVDAEIKKK